MRVAVTTEASRRVPARSVQILSLSGGGYRGLFTAVVLEELERRLGGRPIGDVFDVIAGTSIGGIIACGLAAGVRATEIRKAFERSGPAVFDNRWEAFGRKIPSLPGQGLVRSKYSRVGLEASIAEVLGDRARMRLRDVPRHLVIPAVSATAGRTVVFEGGVFSGGLGDTTLSDVALATSAAPTYFPEHSIGEEAMVDGGIVANAPDQIAIVKAMTSHGCRLEEIRMLSVGTAAEATGELHRPGRSSGALRWILGRNLFGLTIAAQQTLALDLSHEMLGQHLVRIDAIPDAAKASATGLDRADAAATMALRGMAAAALRVADSSRKAELDALLRHRAK